MKQAIDSSDPSGDMRIMGRLSSTNSYRLRRGPQKNGKLRSASNSLRESHFETLANQLFFAFASNQFLELPPMLQCSSELLVGELLWFAILFVAAVFSVLVGDAHMSGLRHRSQQPDVDVVHPPVGYRRVRRDIAASFSLGIQRADQFDALLLKARYAQAMACVAELALAVVGAQQFDRQLLVDELLVHILQHQVAVGDVDENTLTAAAGGGLAAHSLLSEGRHGPTAQTQTVPADDANHLTAP